MNRRDFVIANFALACGGVLGPAVRARAASGPRLPAARILCGFPPGGSADVLARRIGGYLQGRYADAVVIENKTGAAGRIAIEDCKRSRPDGATLLLTPSTTIALFPSLYQNITYGPQDFTPISVSAWIEAGFGVGPGVPGELRDLASYLKWAKANPQDANYATAATGSMPHILGMLLARASSTPLNHVPYRGSSPAVVDLLGGHVPAYCGPIGDWTEHTKSGRLRLFATSGKTRSALTPDVPTFAEQGYPDLVMTQWQGFFMPRDTPAELAGFAASLIKEATTAPGIVTALRDMGMEAGYTTPQETQALLERDFKRWRSIVKDLDIKLES